MPKTALITGASAGIGVELAREFAKGGYNLVLTARRLESLQKLADELQSKYKITATTFAADLAEAQAPSNIYKFTQEQNLTIDVVVNNAGFAEAGKFDKVELQTEMDMVQVNVTALVALSRLYLPGMVERKTGGILNVASTAAFIPGPLMSVYYATKAFVLSLSEALANEVQGTGVKISCLCPGATATEFQARAKMEKSRLFTKGFVMDAATVARMGYEGFEANKTVVICGAANKAAIFVARLVPRSLTAAIARQAQESGI